MGSIYELVDLIFDIRSIYRRVKNDPKFKDTLVPEIKEFFAILAQSLREFVDKIAAEANAK